MAAQWVNSHGYIRKSCLSERFSSFLNAFSVISHRVISSGNEKHRKVLAHGRQMARLLHKVNPLYQIPKQSGAGSKAAQRMGNIRIHDFCIP